MLVILDNGHGIDTLGKRSPIWPDKTQLFEWEFNRDIVKRIHSKLKDLGIESKILVPESEDVSLTKRVRRVNEIYSNRKDSILISVHANAGGGSGIECFTSVGETRSDRIADLFYDAARETFPDVKMRCDYADGDADKESNFTIIKNTYCPAILTENFFMDKYEDCQLLLSDNGREKIADMHVLTIKKYINELSKN